MASAPTSTTISSVHLIKDLTYHVCRSLPEDERRRIFKNTSTTCFNSESWHGRVLEPDEEYDICVRIEKQLKSLHKGDALPKFHQAYRVMKKNESKSIFANRGSILSLLLELSESMHRTISVEEREVDKLFKLNCNEQKKPVSERSPFTLHTVNGQGASQQTIPRSISAEFPIPSRPITKSKSAVLGQPKRPTSLHAHMMDVGILPNKISPSLSKSNKSDSLSLMSAAPRRILATRTLDSATESKVVKELIYSLQGIPGTLFKMDHQQGFIIDVTANIPNESTVKKILELGYLHNRIVSQNNILEKNGAVAQAINYAVRTLLTDYYRMIGCTHSEFTQSERNTSDTPLSETGEVTSLAGGVDDLSILKLYERCYEPCRLLKLLCDVVKYALTGRGGAIFSAVEVFRHYGDSTEMLSFIVEQAGKPLVTMIISWLLNGELHDPFDEFFISMNARCRDRDIWSDKFFLRPSLVPSILTTSQAEEILRTGKGIHFLNTIRDVRLPVEGVRSRLQEMKGCSILDLDNARSEFCQIITLATAETSKLVLDILVNEFMLFEHFQGLRRYILLGQGDFTSYFLELVEPEMRKPASQLQYHKLNSMLGTAIRGSTAAHDNPEVLKRIAVKVLEASSGDLGSDVFGLQYIVDGPLDAALRLSGGAYSHMFNFLWRTKRVEHVLLNMKKERWATKNQLNWLSCRAPEMKSVLMMADLLGQELLHFAREFLYYILLEVVECLWEKFCYDFKKAQSFDDVINSHREFITEMQRKTFQQSDKSRAFINELRLIWDLVFELEALQNRFLDRVFVEVEYRSHREKLLSITGTNEKEKEEFNDREKEFKAHLASIKAQYNIFSRNYQEVLKKFLLELSIQKDHDRRQLSSRLDYNGHYKRMDSRLTDSMKFSRCSDMFTF